ncbi:MAG: proton-conducting transporter membrane subunit [Thiothrix litoralis]|jgi:NADH:ubiquinone oxidoreductase subunit 5 (subunit L)/multisubunit Na+/H+ antiporter MnhA subunit|uniref:proton-conducting transporter transmembrane domain-containing protein n=1 Tax=Thiothrix litoralis TaxID=2891210 RepID=UPI003C7393BE
MPEVMLLLIPGLPLLAALLMVLDRLFGWSKRDGCERFTARLLQAAGSLSLLLVLWADVDYWLLGSRHVLVLPWLHSGLYSASISFMLDPLALSMATLVGLIALLVTRFSVAYLHREAGFQRFFMVMALFTAAMQLIALSGSALLAFVGWELAGVSSYLLIAYNWQSRTAATSATRAFVTNRMGDAGFLLGMFMAFTLFRTTEWDVMLVAQPETSSLLVGVLALGFIAAALVKSAQFPFSAWITRALEGPTPSSTVFYGSLMVHAGIFLLLRIHPLLEQAPVLQWLLLVVGLLTVLYGGLGGMVQTDIKTSLMFATLAQTGLMLVAISFGWYTLALVHLLLHAVWRAYQFLHSPSFALHTQWQPAPAAPAWLGKQRWLHNAALQRFWLDPLADWLLVKPTLALSQEAQVFDGQILDKLSGTPGTHSSIETLADMQALQQGRLRVESSIGVGSGVFGKLMQWVAEHLEWFENRLLLQQDGGKAKTLLDRLGHYIDRVERLLTQPRYLVLLIMATLVVIFRG